MANESAPRIEPQLPSEWSAEALEALGAFPKSLSFVMDRWKAGEKSIRGMNVLGTFAHYPALTKAFMTLNAHVASASTLAVRARELAILRLSWLRRMEYEFVQHIILGMRAGITAAELEQIEVGASSPSWAPIDAVILRAVDDMYEDAGISGKTWQALSDFYDTKQIMDLIVLVGLYDMLGTAINSFQTPLETDAPPLDPAVKKRMFAPRNPRK